MICGEERELSCAVESEVSGLRLGVAVRMNGSGVFPFIQEELRISNFGDEIEF